MCKASLYNDRHLIWKFVRLFTTLIPYLNETSLDEPAIRGIFASAGFTDEDLEYCGIDFKPRDPVVIPESKPTHKELMDFWENR